MNLKSIVTNTTRKFIFKYKDSNNAPIDITGATGVLVVKKSKRTTQPLLTVDAVIEGAEGIITFDITPILTKDIELKGSCEKFLIGAVLTLADESVISLLQGDIEIVQNVVTA